MGNTPVCLNEGLTLGEMVEPVLVNILDHLLLLVISALHIWTVDADHVLIYIVLKPAGKRAVFLRVKAVERMELDIRIASLFKEAARSLLRVLALAAIHKNRPVFGPERVSLFSKQINH